MMMIYWKGGMVELYTGASLDNTTSTITTGAPTRAPTGWSRPTTRTPSSWSPRLMWSISTVSVWTSSTPSRPASPGWSEQTSLDCWQTALSDWSVFSSRTTQTFSSTLTRTNWGRLTTSTEIKSFIIIENVFIWLLKNKKLIIASSPNRRILEPVRSSVAV